MSTIHLQQNRIIRFVSILVCIGLHLLLVIAICRSTLFTYTRPKQEQNNRVQIVLIPATPVTIGKTAPLTNPVAPLIRHALTAPSRAKRPAPIASHQIVKTEPIAKLQDNPPSTEKHLDMQAIHDSIGKIVAEVDREDSETPVFQLRRKPLYANDGDNDIAKGIRNSGRSDCRDSIAGTGLLAPLVILAMALDKKDGGCKW